MNVGVLGSGVVATTLASGFLRHRHEAMLGTRSPGKPVLDATNPIADAPPANGVLKFFTSLDDSLMERLQREFPAARFVKAFNSVGSALMINPSLAGAARAIEPLCMLWCIPGFLRDDWSHAFKLLS